MDLKAVGYLISTVSVVLLGFAAWPSGQEPEWKNWALVSGMVTSIIGMGVRYVSHRHDREDIHHAAHDREPAQ